MLGLQRDANSFLGVIIDTGCFEGLIEIKLTAACFWGEETSVSIKAQNEWESLDEIKKEQWQQGEGGSWHSSGAQMRD